jgi:hypothetical protein
MFTAIDIVYPLIKIHKKIGKSWVSIILNYITFYIPLLIVFEIKIFHV